MITDQLIALRSVMVLLSIAVAAPVVLYGLIRFFVGLVG